MLKRFTVFKKSIFIFFLLFISPVFARNIQGDFSDLVEKLLPSVVNISTTQGLEGSGDLPVFPPGSPVEKLNDFLGTGPKLTKSLGSGFVIDPDGIIITNYHVIEDAETIEITFSDGLKTKAEIMGYDPLTDLAVLKVNISKKLASIEFADSDHVKPGQWVLAIGNPLGYGGSVSAGIVSARNRNIHLGNYDEFIQTDVAINRGNSGGPLFNMNGDVIGVNTAILSPTGYSIGISFTTSSNLVKSVVNQILKYGEAKRGWLGVSIQPVNYEIALAYGIEEVMGALIQSVARGGPAQKAGLKAGDLVLEYNGKSVSDDRALSRLVAETLPGERAKIRLLRGKTEKTIQVRLQKFPEKNKKKRKESSEKEQKPEVENDLFGLVCIDITPKIRTRYRLAPTVKGVLVSNVKQDSPFYGKVIERDVIEQLSFEDILDFKTFKTVIEQAAKQKNPVLILLNRQGEQIFHSVQLGSKK